jgi:hypothetical protein
MNKGYSISQGKEGKMYPEPLSGFSLLSRLFDLLSPRLLFVLPLSNAIVVLKSKQNIETW